jgi:hypothetical protein
MSHKHAFAYRHISTYLFSCAYINMSFNTQVKKGSTDHKAYIKYEDVTQLTNACSHLSCV